MREGTPRRGRIVSALVAVAVMVGVMQVGLGAKATFPGTNGLIAYVSATRNVFVVNPSNPVPTQVTNTGTYSRLSWKADGSQLVAASDAGLALLQPVAGSAVTIIPNTFGNDFGPSFDPTGTKVAFSRGAQTEIITIETSGANRSTIFSDAAGAQEPEWSADGTFIAFATPSVAVRRISPTGGSLVTLATAGVGAACSGANPCQAPTVSPDNKEVAFQQANAGCAACGLSEVNADGSNAATPRRLTNVNTDRLPHYSPDGTKLAFTRGDPFPAGTVLHTVPSDGSATATSLGITGVQETNWGVAAGTGTGTGGTGTGTGGSVISVSATRTGANCVFNIVATPAAAGITVDFQVTNNKGVVKLTGNDVSVPASPSVKAKKRGRNKVRNIALSDAKGATIGTASATCAK